MLFGLANWTWLKAMDELLPSRPTLFFDLVLPSRSKYLLLNLWIADSHCYNSNVLVASGELDGVSEKERLLYSPIQRTLVASETITLKIRFAGSMGAMAIFHQPRCTGTSAERVGVAGI